jgi:hypothetical protein
MLKKSENNPSKLYSLKYYLERGMITESEYLRLRREALEKNVYAYQRQNKKQNRFN